jgi:hypothetical protein
MNPYQSTIAAVGGILDNYDSDKLYPVYGFGAKVQLGWTSQCCAGVIKLLRANTEHWSWITDYSGQLFACNSSSGGGFPLVAFTGRHTVTHGIVDP